MFLLYRQLCLLPVMLCITWRVRN